MPRTRTIPVMKVAASRGDFHTGCEVGAKVVLLVPDVAAVAAV